MLELLGPSAGGIRRHVDVLARHLDGTGWEAVVAGPAGVMDGLATPARPVAVGLDPRALWSARRVLRRLVAQEGVAVVHAHGLTAGWTAVLARPGVPIVLTVHNVVLGESAGRLAPLLARLERALPRRVAATIAVSSAIARDIEARSGADVEVVIPASDPPVVARDRAAVRAALDVDDATPLVASVARLHPQKALPDLLTAMVTVREAVPEAVLAVVGDGPVRPDLEREADRLGLDGAVRFVGAQPDGPSWMAAADVVAVSSIWEGSPLAVAEALRLGRPLVATDVGDIAEVVVDGETGRLVPPSQPPALAAALVDLLGDPEAAAALGARGRDAAVARYGTEALVRRVAAVYDRVATTDDPTPGGPA